MTLNNMDACKDQTSCYTNMDDKIFNKALPLDEELQAMPVERGRVSFLQGHTLDCFPLFHGQP